MSLLSLSPSERQQLLVEECRQWIGVQESGGNNRGQIVEIFLKSAGLTAGNPWCMAFIQRAIRRVDCAAMVLKSDSVDSKIYKSAHCLTVWNQSPKDIKTHLPVRGSVVIWQHSGTSEGHTGVVSEVLPDRAFKAIEGNTSPDKGVNREGDGVFEKHHTVNSTGSMIIVGFLLPWGLDE